MNVVFLHENVYCQQLMLGISIRVGFYFYFCGTESAGERMAPSNASPSK